MISEIQKNNNYCLWLIVVALLVNAIGLFSQILPSGDAIIYASVSKTIMTQNDWGNLYTNGQAFLDKPHFPFWVTALSFKLLGTSVFAYILPGFIFNCIGAYYTYQLAKQLYSKDIAILSTLIYVTSLTLMISSIDVRAEAFLMGEIIPAAYYWLQYDRNSGAKNLCLGAFFTALALMTKGPFVLAPIFSGLIIRWIYLKEYRKIIQIKWLSAYALSLICTLPELIALYRQFNFAGLTWFFYGSQFNRFLTTTGSNPPLINHPIHFIFFCYTFLWEFMPWTPVFLAMLYHLRGNFKQMPPIEKTKIVYLHASFWPSFIMFSLTPFQHNYFINIIIPFVAILSANYLTNSLSLEKWHSRWQFIQANIILISSTILVALIFAFSATQKIPHHLLLALILLCPIGMLIWFYKVKPSLNLASQAILFPSLSVSCVFLCYMCVKWVADPFYDANYSIAKSGIISNAQIPIYGLQSPATPGTINELEIWLNNPTYNLHNGTAVTTINAKSYYFIALDQDMKLVTFPAKTQIQKMASYSVLSRHPTFHLSKTPYQLKFHYLECESLYLVKIK